MKHSVITIDKKKYVLLTNEEYCILKQDIIDLKKVLTRRSESGVEANLFFKNLKAKHRAIKS